MTLREDAKYIIDAALKSAMPDTAVEKALQGFEIPKGKLVLVSAGKAGWQMAKTAAAIGRLKDAGLPFISVLTDPTTGGVSASYAMLGDINITEPGALIGFAGRRVIENTIRQKLPDDFQTAEYLKAHGFIDKIVERKDLKAFIVKMLKYFGF